MSPLLLGDVLEECSQVASWDRVADNTGKAKGGKQCSTLPTPPAGSLLRDASFYGQVGGQNNMRNSEGKHFDLDFEPVTIPSNCFFLPHTPRIPLTIEG